LTFGLAIDLAIGLTMMAVMPSLAVPLGDLPGEDISASPAIASPTLTKPKSGMVIERTNSWLAPSVEDQLSRERTLIPLGRGALFIPSFTEPRREPEVTLFNDKGTLVQDGQTGERILLDSGSYTVRLGSGTMGQQISMKVTISEGHTLVEEPFWSGLVVETLLPNGEYIDGQYEVIRMGKWINYGKGHGLKSERLQDIKTWLLPPGLYRISKPGEGFSSLRNYITVQLNPGELHKVEVIFDKEAGDIVSGGVKSLNARVKVGNNWTFGVRAGGNVNLARLTDGKGVRNEAMQVSSDARLQVQFDNVRYLGTTELLLQDNFSKAKGRPFIVTSDLANLRTNWVRRLNTWLGPYVRGSVESHLFPRNAERETIYIIRELSVPKRSTLPSNPLNLDSTAMDTVQINGSKDFETTSSLDPMKFSEGVGVNIEFLSQYYLEANTQIGVAGRQNVALESYVGLNDSVYIKGQSKYEIGAENTLNATLRLGSQATLDLRTEVFAPNGDITNIRLDDLTADLRFFISRNLEIGYIYQVKESLEKVKNRYPSSHIISLRLSFNF
jgi:hypothetical protein